MSLSLPRSLRFARRRTARALSRYVDRDLQSDALAGLTVAVMGVPQAMAYAMIADLPPVYGLYTAIATCIVAALLGSSNHLVTGPTNATCMVILSLTAPLSIERGLAPLEIVFLLTFLIGLLQLSFGIFRLGGLVRYVSNSVVVGFTAGAGILIAVNQLRNILGVDFTGLETARFYQAVAATVRMIPETNPFALAIGVLTALTAIYVPRVDKRLPGALLGIVFTATLAYVLGWHGEDRGASRIDVVRDIQPISANLLEMVRVPELFFPVDLSLVLDLAPGALALAILGLVEATSIARAIAASSGQRLDFNRHFIGQGMGNVVGPFFSCFAGSGSFTRTSVNYASGGRTRMAAVFSALWTALTVLILAPMANYIPKAALAGILIVIAYSMIDKHRLELTWKTGAKSRLVLFGTFASTLVLPLEYAIFVGVFLSIVILLQITGKVDLTQLVPSDESGFEEVPFNRAAPSPVVTINMEGDLYFAAVEDLDHELLQALTPRTRVVVLRMKRLRAVGSTAMAILEHFWNLLKEREIQLVVCGIEAEIAKVMTRSGLRKQIGEQNIFYADNRLFQSTELAHARAWSLVNRDAQAVEPELGEEEDEGAITAESIMSARCIRFGQQHQIREAAWLMSEMLKHLGPAAPPSLFLQDAEGKLFGELSMWRLIRSMKGGLKSEELADLDDDDLRPRLREHFSDTIGELARTHLPRLRPYAGIAELTMAAVRRDLAALPITNDDGLAVGLVRPADLLAAIGRALELDRFEETPRE